MIDLSLQEVEQTQRKVDDFYKEWLEHIRKKIEKNKNTVKRIGGKERKLKQEIEDKEEKIKEIYNDDDNYVNRNKQNRLKSFGLEKDIFDYENKINELKQKLEWHYKKNETRIKYLKEENDRLMKEYEKIYNEKAEIDDAIIKGVLGKDVDIGDIMAAKELKEENDVLFTKLINQ